MNNIISFVIPVFNEGKNIPILTEEIFSIESRLNKQVEIIFVDDGSSDNSFDELIKAKAKHPNIKIIKFKRNFGQTAAISAGFDQAKGDIVITLDSDLQNDPEDIPKIISELEKGYDVVSGWRKNRKDAFLTRRVPSVLANLIISWYTGVKLHDYGCTLKAYRREVLKDLNLYGELHRFIPALVSFNGAKIKEIEVNHRSRKFGKSNYGFSRTISVILDLLTVKFLLVSSKGPMQIFGRIAMWYFFFGLFSVAAAIIMKISSGTDLTGNPLLYLSLLFVIVSLQFISMGLLGEINIRVFNRNQKSRVYTVEEILD